MISARAENNENIKRVMRDDRDGNFIISSRPLPKTKRFKMENIVNVGLALRSLIHLFGVWHRVECHAGNDCRQFCQLSTLFIFF